MKRAFDFIVACFGLLVALPILAVMAIWIKWDSRGPVFYRGTRVGRFGLPFRIFKFRSMVVDADKIGGASTSDRDPRITHSGRFIRKFKLDELPQLINVVWGDMSLVGPRPEVQKYIDMYTPEQKQILNVRPGITDWASIWNSDEGAVLAKAADPDRAYEELILPTKIQLQLKYVREQSLITDIKIMCFTALRLLRKDWLPAELAPYGKLVPAEATQG